MSESKTVLFKINYLDSSSIPIEIIDRVASILPDSVQVHVLVLFENTDYSRGELPINASDMEIHRFRATGRINLFKRIPDLLKWIYTLSPDIIHTNHKYSSLLLPQVVRDSHCKIVHTIHSNYCHYDVSSKLDFSLIFSAADYIIYNSTETRQSWARKYNPFNSAKERVVYNGVNQRLLREAKSDKSDTKINILSVGRFVDEKNFELALKAMDNLVSNGYKDVQFILTGGGPLEGKYRRLVARQGLSDYVAFPGFLERKDVYRLMWASDIYLLTSHYEGFCNAAVEAMFTENIVVSSDIEPLRTEVVGDSGIYFRSDDVGSLTRMLENTIDQLDEFDDVRDDLMSRARQEFDLSTTAERYADIYIQLLNS